MKQERFSRSLLPFTNLQTHQRQIVLVCSHRKSQKLSQCRKWTKISSCNPLDLKSATWIIHSIPTGEPWLAMEAPTGSLHKPSAFFMTYDPHTHCFLFSYFLHKYFHKHRWRCSIGRNGKGPEKRFCSSCPWIVFLSGSMFHPKYPHHALIGSMWKYLPFLSWFNTDESF